MSSSYADRLKDPRWQRRRLEVLSAANWTCQVCSATEKTLHVHHRLYRKGAMPWEYDDRELQVLCEPCHEKVTHWSERLRDAIAEMDHFRLQELVGFAEGLVAKDKVFVDDEEQDRERSWPLSSHGHTWGFVACVGFGVPQKLIDQLMEAQPLSFGDVYALGAEGLEWTKADHEST